MSAAIMIAAAFVTAISQILLKQSASQDHAGIVRQYLNGRVILGYALMMSALVMNIWAYRTIEYHLGPDRFEGEDLKKGPSGQRADPDRDSDRPALSFMGGTCIYAQ